jgi:hypothetical protein
MDERQKLRDDLERYRTLRDLITDEPAIEVIEIMIKERKTAWPTLRGGGAIRMARIAPESFTTVRRGSMISRPDPDPAGYSSNTEPISHQEAMWPKSRSEHSSGRVRVPSIKSCYA